MATQTDKAPDKTVPTESKSNTGGDIDRVQMASRLPDGTPHQTPGFEFVGDRESTEAAAKTQLGQQAVSAADVRERLTIDRERQEALGIGEVPQDPTVERLQKVHERALQAGEKRATQDAERADE